MGPGTTGSSGEAYQPHHQCANTCQTRRYPTIRTRGGCVPNRYGSNPLSTRQTSKTTRRDGKARTTQTSRLPLPEIHHHRAELPHLQPGVPRDHTRTQTMVLRSNGLNGATCTIYEFPRGVVLKRGYSRSSKGIALAGLL